ncbi:MAG: isopentenyl-diphosphate Delta-isomerase [Geodermatophilaceae bacterium]|nr:isopentenyl-diphosphate Delta-isomerase [Geodermatophilaceae bacterium]
MGASQRQGVGVTDEWVVLLDEQRRPIGRQLKSEVHHSDTPLHLAFSVHVFDDDDNTLLTRRAVTKRAWPGVWTNACCGHPAPEEDLVAAVTRRLSSELGLVPQTVSLALADFAYRARDAAGVVENEVCPVFRARVPGRRPSPVADSDEVAEWVWLSRSAVARLAREYPWLLSPWSVLQFAELDATARNASD